MARIRTVKPGLFRHENLFELERKTGLPIRIAWIGLFTVADREGRFEWKPNILKLDILPWDDLDFSLVLEALKDAQFIRQYEVNGKQFGYIPTWNEHQKPHHTEPQSRLPDSDVFDPPMPNGELPVSSPEPNGYSPLENGQEEEKEEEEEGKNEPAVSAGNQPLLEDNFTKPFLDRIRRDVQEAWIKTYEDPVWIKFEIKKAITWCKAKPRRAPKSDYQKFMTDWLARGWESYRKKPSASLERNTKPVNLEDIA